MGDATRETPSEVVTSPEVGGLIDVQNPATSAIVGRIPNQTREEVLATAAELRRAQPAWEALGFEGRAGWMERWRDWMLDNDKRLTRMLQEERSRRRTGGAADRL